MKYTNLSDEIDRYEGEGLGVGFWLALIFGALALTTIIMELSGVTDNFLTALELWIQ